MPNVWGGLSRFNSHHNNLGIDTSESVNDNLALNRLNWINDNGNSSRIQHFLTFLSLDISAWEPWSKTWMRVIPSHAHLISSYLFHHVHKLLLENGVDWLNTDSCTFLRHWEHIYYCNRIVIMNFSNHEAHDFERNSGSWMLKHFQ